METTYDSRIDLLETYVERDVDAGDSVRNGNCILHRSSDSSVIGLEILNASETLGSSTDFLKSIEEAKIVSKFSEGSQEVYITLKTGSKSCKKRFSFPKASRRALV
ncbi:MAG: hypothetical protein SVV03_05730 [Candidatus Nanohaloarchaea archaeon]|nr:hypothetical protein [Candidatus Nanohaloarchaea archaeon]